MSVLLCSSLLFSGRLYYPLQLNALQDQISSGRVDFRVESASDVLEPVSFLLFPLFLLHVDNFLFYMNLVSVFRGPDFILFRISFFLSFAFSMQSFFLAALVLQSIFLAAHFLNHYA